MVLPSFSALFKRRPPLPFPMFDGHFVPLVRPALGLLEAVAQGFEQTAHVRRMIAHPELFADHFVHPLTHPYLSPKAVSSARRSRSSGTLARSSSLRRGGAPGAGWRLLSSLNLRPSQESIGDHRVPTSRWC